MADSPEAIKKAKKKYLFVLGILFIGTILTVAVAVFEPWDIGERGFSTGDLILGLAIASTKAFFVMYVFMHLNDEKKMIYLFYGMSIFFGLCLYFLIKLAFVDPIKFSGFFTGIAG